MKRDTKLIAFLVPTDMNFFCSSGYCTKIYSILKNKIHVEFHSFCQEWIMYCIEVH